MPDPKNILVIGPSWVGDIVMAQALYRALKRLYPAANIDAGAPAYAVGLLGRMPELRAGVVLPFGHGEGRLADRWRFARSLKGKYDTAYVLPGSWKSAIVPFAAGIRCRIGYLKEQRWLLLNRIMPLPREFKRKTALNFQALADPQVFARPAGLLLPRLTVDPANQAELLGRSGLRSGRYVALMPGAEYGPAKRWPARHYVAVAQEIRARGYRVVLVGAEKDRPVTAEIASLAPGALDLAGTTRLIDVVDLLAGAALAVSNDSGLMHVAAAVEIPVYGIFGSTSPQNTPPLSPLAETVTLSLACSPCNKRECPLGSLDCLETLTPDLLLKRILPRLEPA